MSSVPAQAATWPRRRWWLLTGLIFVSQVTLIFWLGEHGHPRPRALGPAPGLRLVRGWSQALALQDPTVFALPHRQGFSGPAWLDSKPLEFPAYDWSEPPRWLPMSLAPLSDNFSEVQETNPFDPIQLLAGSAPELTRPDPIVLAPARGQSSCRLEGGLAGRKLLSNPKLPPWQRPEILTNSVVQLVVDGQGRPLSAVLLSSSGWKEADDLALAEARMARLEPLQAAGPQPASRPSDELSWGELIFEWQTLPPASPAP